MNPDSINPREAIHLDKKSERKSFWEVWAVILVLILADFALVGLAYLTAVGAAKEAVKLPLTHIDRLFITKSATVVGLGEPKGISIDYKTFIAKAQHSETIMIVHIVGDTLRLDAYCSKSNFVYNYVHRFESPNSFTSVRDYHYDPITGYFTVEWQRHIRYPILYPPICFATVIAVILVLIIGFSVYGNPVRLFRYPPEG